MSIEYRVSSMGYRVRITYYFIKVPPYIISSIIIMGK